MHRNWWAVLAVAAILIASPALAETRVALVIGNSNYAHAPRLANPPNDVAAVAAALRQAGFSVVTIRHDLTEEQFKSALLEFSRAARNADVAVVHYSGHGIEVGGTNYLVPVDATLASDSDVDFEAVPLDLVLHAVEGARRLRLVLLDACRSNPFANTMARTNATRAIGRGLARVEPSSDTLVVYAAKAGSTASDGNGAVSPFSAAFARDVVQPGVEINKLFRLVHDQVMASTNPQQEPFVYGSLSAADFYFVAPVPGTPNVVAAPDPRAEAAHAELALWQSLANSNDVVKLNAYLAQYPNGTFADVVRAKLAALSQPARPNVQVASLPPQTALSDKDFLNVLGLTQKSTLADAVALFGSSYTKSGDAYIFSDQGSDWLYYTPGNKLNIICVDSRYTSRPPLAQLCAANEDQLAQMLSGIRYLGGGDWATERVWVSILGSRLDRNISISWTFHL